MTDVRGEPSRPPLAAGARVGVYTIVRPIALGGMGAVYLASDDDGRSVALKCLRDERQAARFEIEARLLTGLRHPRVVRVVDHWQDVGGSFLAMELVQGTDLDRLLSEEGVPGLPVARVLEYGAQACEALHYVHSQHVVHRDVKPANLIVGRDGVVLVDFGIARSLDRTDSTTRAIGTPRFMAPEVFVGEDVSPRSDVYGLGATLWTLITGEPPSYHDPTPLAERHEGVSPELERTLRAALEIQPERRLASVAALAAALDAPLGTPVGASLALSVVKPLVRRNLLESIVHTAAGVLDAAAASIALIEPATGELVYQAAWGAGGQEIVGVRMAPRAGIAGAAIASGEPVIVADCRTDPRFAARIAAGTGYVPHTMLVAPLVRDGVSLGALSLLDRRDGIPFGPPHVVRAELFAELTVAALPSPSGGEASS